MMEGGGAVSWDVGLTLALLVRQAHEGNLRCYYCADDGCVVRDAAVREIAAGGYRYEDPPVPDRVADGEAAGVVQGSDDRRAEGAAMAD